MSAPVRDERRPGWLWIDNSVLLEHGATLGANGLAVYVGLASYANADRTAWPGMRGLAKRLGMGTATVQRAIKQLEALGLIQVERVASTQGDRETNRYRLLRQGEAGCTATDTPVPLGPQGVPLGTHGVPLGTHGGVPLGPRNKSHSFEQEPKNKSTDDFDAFWTVYPKKVGKEAARRAWQKTAKRRPLLATLLEAVHRARRSPQWLKDDGQYIPNPATWLNEGRWDDEPTVLETPRASGLVPFAKQPGFREALEGVR